ncbi:MAG: alpha/beta hydrolase [Deltaproteobacteria bacterium]|nr:alpha/beta hydrolase [Deltaproteobacteria bacterium]
MAPTERLIDVGEVRLNVAIQGEGKPVLLLHGFPEFWYSWRHQMDALASAGFCAIAPDLRGYNKSDKPRDVSAYRLDRIEQDVVGLLKALGHEKAHVVGHDWGGALAWTFGARHGEHVDKLVVMNAPPPGRMLRAFRTRKQLAKSWYMFFFQLPFLPERATRDPNFMRRALRGMAVNKVRFSDADIARFEEAYAQPGAATGALNWYRAAFRYPKVNLKLPPAERPTMLIWGERDTALGLELLEGLEPFARDLRIERIPNASHWVQQDAPEEVNKLLLQFLRG